VLEQGRGFSKEEGDYVRRKKVMQRRRKSLCKEEGSIEGWERVLKRGREL
jgi:hypothetical protein